LNIADLGHIDLSILASKSFRRDEDAARQSEAARKRRGFHTPIGMHARDHTLVRRTRLE
jgi:hypothetical protein